MLGDIKFDLLSFLTLLFFCLIKKIYEILVKKNKTTQVVLFLQLGISIIILLTFKLSLFTFICLMMLIFFSHIFIVDLEKFIIPYSSLIGLLILGIFNLFLENPLNISIISRILSFIIFLLIWFILNLIQNKLGKDFLGGGDLMLFCVVSLLLGGLIVTLGIFFGSFIALIVHMIKNDKKIFAFGPYLVSGFLIALLLVNFIKK